MPILEYYKQWQQINRDPEKWQLDRVKHSGLLYAYDWVNKYATNVLDVGCGIAEDRKHFTIPYQGIDITPKFVVTAHKHQTPVLRATVTALPFKNEAFDAVYCHNLLLHLPPPMWQQALTEMIRVAKHYVVTVEPEWQQENDFRPRETLEENPDNILIFYSNTYSREEMTRFAHELGMEFQFVSGYDGERSSFLKKDVCWQVTIYTKK